MFSRFLQKYYYKIIISLTHAPEFMLSKLSLSSQLSPVMTIIFYFFFTCLRYWNGCYDIYERTLNINKCTSSYISNYDSSNAFHIKYYMNTLYDTLVRHSIFYFYSTIHAIL